MSFLGKLFGSDDALAKVVDTASDLLDEAFYTKEEQAADRAAARDKAQGMVIEWIQSSTGSRLARRLIALSITGTWLLMYVIASLMSFFSVWSAPFADRLTASSQLLDARSETMVPPVMIILGFYFAAPYMGDMAKAALEKFGKTGVNK